MEDSVCLTQHARRRQPNPSAKADASLLEAAADSSARACPWASACRAEHTRLSPPVSLAKARLQDPPSRSDAARCFNSRPSGGMRSAVRRIRAAPARFSPRRPAHRIHRPTQTLPHASAPAHPVECSPPCAALAFEQPHHLRRPACRIHRPTRTLPDASSPAHPAECVLPYAALAFETGIRCEDPSAGSPAPRKRCRMHRHPLIRRNAFCCAEDSCCASPFFSAKARPQDSPPHADDAACIGTRPSGGMQSAVRGIRGWDIHPASKARPAVLIIHMPMLLHPSTAAPPSGHARPQHPGCAGPDLPPQPRPRADAAGLRRRPARACPVTASPSPGPDTGWSPPAAPAQAPAAGTTSAP